jgi:threonine/homoserine/homoserine lactone efflux protein
LIAGAFGLGATLGLLPGPVQFVLLTEATRGGVRRGFAAMAGANGTFGVMLLSLAAGLAVIAPAETALRVLKIAGGAFLVFLAADAFVATVRGLDEDPGRGRGRTPLIRGVFAVLLNPGAWVFLATTASALFASAVEDGGRPLALLAAVVMLGGVSLVDGIMVLLGGGIRRFEERVARWLTPILAVGLAVFGVILLIEGIRG